MTLTLTPQTDRVVLRRDTSSGVRYFDGTRMVAGETGWVDADAYLPWLTRTGVTSPTIRMRRVSGQFVELEIRAAFARGAGDAILPVGWRPSRQFSLVGILSAGVGATFQVANWSSSSRLTPESQALAEGTLLRGTLMFSALDWPVLAPPPFFLELFRWFTAWWGGRGEAHQDQPGIYWDLVAPGARIHGDNRDVSQRRSGHLECRESSVFHRPGGEREGRGDALAASSSRAGSRLCNDGDVTARRLPGVGREPDYLRPGRVDDDHDVEGRHPDPWTGDVQDHSAPALISGGAR